MEYQGLSAIREHYYHPYAWSEMMKGKPRKGFSYDYDCFKE